MLPLSLILLSLAVRIAAALLLPAAMRVLQASVQGIGLPRKASGPLIGRRRSAECTEPLQSSSPSHLFPSSALPELSPALMQRSHVPCCVSHALLWLPRAPASPVLSSALHEISLRPYPQLPPRVHFLPRARLLRPLPTLYSLKTHLLQSQSASIFDRIFICL
jgi:hypothetical protein